jgi:hypothetical protein
VFDMFLADMRKRGVAFNAPSDPLRDVNFIQTLTRVYDLGKPNFIPEDPVAPRAAAE